MQNSIPIKIYVYICLCKCVCLYQSFGFCCCCCSLLVSMHCVTTLYACSWYLVPLFVWQTKSHQTTYKHTRGKKWNENISQRLTVINKTLYECLPGNRLQVFYLFFYQLLWSNICVSGRFFSLLCIFIWAPTFYSKSKSYRTQKETKQEKKSTEYI